MIKKTIAAFLSLFLVVMSPGISSYQAVAASFEAEPSGVASPIPAFQLPVQNFQNLPQNQDILETQIPINAQIPRVIPENIHSTTFKNSIEQISPKKNISTLKLETANQSPTRNEKTPKVKVTVHKENFFQRIHLRTVGTLKATKKGLLFSRQIRRETKGWEKPVTETNVTFAPKTASNALALEPAQRKEDVPFSLPTPALGNAKKWALSLGALAGVSFLIPHLTVTTLAMVLGSAASIVIHEAAHLWMLRRLGDDTAALHGMAKVNALSFIDPLTTITLPLITAAVSRALLGFPIAFGWGRPIPVDFNKLKNVQKDVAKVAAAGPLSNLALAAGASLIAALVGGPVSIALFALAKINLGLAAFNLIPLPQMDGGKIAIGLLSKKLYQVWIKNPALPDSYQHTYQKLYEGPANILTRLKLTDRKRVGVLSMATAFVASLAFTAFGLFWLGGPFAFLTLACAYDYYCVREKIQNEEAVQSLMGLLQGFAADLAKMAEEDATIESAINPETVEHTLKQVMEDVLDQVIDSEGFASLSNDEKWARFEAAYMDAAVKALKANGMAADDPETIRTVLKSEMARQKLLDPIRAWIDRYEVWQKWKSPERKGENTSSSTETKHANGSGRSLAMGLLMVLGLGASAILAPHMALAQHLTMASAGIGPMIMGSLGQAPESAPEESKSFEELVQDPKYKFSPQEQQLLQLFLTDMVAEESDGQPVSGREKELSEIHKIVTAPRGDITSAILYGPKGVGKTAILEKYAQSLALSQSGKTPSALSLQKMKGRSLLRLDLSRLLVGDKPAQKLQLLIDLLTRFNDPDKRTGNKVVLFIDEIHRLFQDKDGEKMANMLKEPLARGKLSIIAATTEKEYKQFIEPDEAFSRRLYPIYVREETPPETLRALEGAKAYLENLYGMTISPEAFKAAAELSGADQELQLPGRAFKYFHLAAREADFNSQKDRLSLMIQNGIQEVQYVIRRLADEMAKTQTVTQNLREDEPTTISLYNRLADLSRGLAALYRKKAAIPSEGNPKVTGELVKHEIASQTGVEEGQLTSGPQSAEKYLDMEKIIGKRVIGQDEAIHAIAEAIRMNKAGLSMPNRPMGVFYLTGPTGVGKTHLGKELARFLFDDPDALIRIDMSEFQESHTVARLIGSPPGYVGYESGGQLTEKVRRKPYSVILFDEIEKAHPDVWFLLLQILGEGRLTDGQGRTVDFSHTMILMTSNLGMREIDLSSYVQKFEALKAETAEAQKRGDQAKLREIEAKKEALSQEISRETKIKAQEVTDTYFKSVFPPEFRGRLHAPPLVFERITPKTAKNIIDLDLKELARLLSKSGHELTWTPALVSFLADKGFSVDLGARPLKNALDLYVTQPISRKILESAKNGVSPQKIIADVDHGEVKLTVEPFKAKAPEKKDPQEGAADEIFNQALAQALKMAADPSQIGASEEIIHSWANNAITAYPEETPIAGKTSSVAQENQAKNVDAENSGVPSAQNPQLAPVQPFFNPNTPLEVSGQALETSSSHYDPARKDAQLLAFYKTLHQSLSEAGYPQETQDYLLKTIEDVQNPYLGFLPLLIAQAKESTSADRRETPVKVFSELGENSVKVLIHRNGPITDREEAFLKTHFGGPAPQSPEESRNKAEALNVRGKDGRRLLLDLYRVLAQIPGTCMGYASKDKARGGAGTDYWIEIPKLIPEPSAKPQQLQQEEAPLPEKNRSAAKTLTAEPLYLDEIAKNHLRDYLFALLHQKDERSPSVRMAASALLAQLSTAADLEKARDWMRFEPSLLGKWYPEVSAAAQILAQYGDDSDEMRLRSMLTQLSAKNGDLYTSTKHRIIEALAQSLLRSIDRTPHKQIDLIDEFQRTATLGGQGLILFALTRALEESGAIDPNIADVLQANSDADWEPLYRYKTRTDPTFFDTLYQKYNQSTDFISFRENLNPIEKTLLPFAIAEKGSQEDAAFFKKTFTSFSNQNYFNRDDLANTNRLLSAYGLFVNRLGLYPQLRSELWHGLDSSSSFNLDSESDTTGMFIRLMAAISAAKTSGDESDLANLEHIMRYQPEEIHYTHEITQQAAAEAWASIVVRTGLIKKYIKPEVGVVISMLSDTNPLINKAVMEALRLGLGGK